MNLIFDDNNNDNEESFQARGTLSIKSSHPQDLVSFWWNVLIEHMYVCTFPPYALINGVRYTNTYPIQTSAYYLITSLTYICIVHTYDKCRIK